VNVVRSSGPGAAALAGGLTIAVLRGEKCGELERLSWL
jgi:hypothetical protein